MLKAISESKHCKTDFNPCVYTRLWQSSGLPPGNKSQSLVKQVKIIKTQTQFV